MVAKYSQHKVRYCLHTMVCNRFVFTLFSLYYLVIRVTWLEGTGCDTKRFVCRRTIVRNTIVKSTRYVQRDYFSRLLRLLNINFRDQFILVIIPY